MATLDELRQDFGTKSAHLEEVRKNTREAAVRLAHLNRGDTSGRDLREVRAERLELSTEVNGAPERVAKAATEKALAHLRVLHADAEQERERARGEGRPAIKPGVLQLEARSAYPGVNLFDRGTWPGPAQEHGQKEAERLQRELERDGLR
jgi:hypothetical protein